LPHGIYTTIIYTSQDAGHLSIPNYQQAVITAYEVGTQLPPAAQPRGIVVSTTT